jgi:hypothetical protein
MCYSTGDMTKWGGPLFVAALAGVIALWRSRRRGLLGTLLVPLVASFAAFVVARVWAADRFVLVLLPVYAVLIGIGAASVVRAVAARGPALRVALAVVGVVLLAVGALRIYHFNQGFETPSQDYKGISAAATATGVPVVYTDDPPNFNYGLRWYVGRKLDYLSPPKLARQLCLGPAPLAFIQHIGRLTAYEANCLAHRFAAAEDFHGGILRLWLIQTPGAPIAARQARGAAAPVRPAIIRPHPLGVGGSCRPTAAVAPAPGVAVPGSALTVSLGPGFRVTIKPQSVRIVHNVPSAAPSKPFTAAGGALLALTLTVTDVGRAKIAAIDALKGLVVADASGHHWQLADSVCDDISNSYAAQSRAPVSPSTVLAPGEVGTTGAVYAVPAGTRFALESRTGEYIRLKLSR